jgi:hypothetical protein
MAKTSNHAAGGVKPGHYIPSMRTKTIYAVAMFFGLVLFGTALMMDQARAWHSFLVSFFFFTNLALGGLFFTAIQHAAKAGWSVNIRRFAEAMSSFLPVAAVAAVVLLLGAKSLYVWLDPKELAENAILRGKSSYLNMGFFVVRLAIFFGAWILFRKTLVGNSLKQDQDGDENHTVKNVAVSVAFLLVFAISYSLFSVDTLMSLQPEWYSTIWGVYCFAGLFQSSIAVLTIITVTMMRKGLVRGLVSHDHLHDLGKFMLAFTVFYAYIGFSQFLLIWYANLPEETIFYIARSSGGWMAVTFSLLIFKFIVPFLLMLPKAAKRNPAHLTLVGCLILVMQYVDLHWIVYPNLVNGDFEKYAGKFILSWPEIGSFLMFGGLFLWSVTSFLTKNPLVPVRDPRIEESIHHHVTY